MHLSLATIVLLTRFFPHGEFPAGGYVNCEVRIFNVIHVQSP
jgi:hypothetical protein